MKSPKTKLALLIAISASTTALALGWTVSTLAARPSGSDQTEAISAIDKDEAEIGSRLKMSSAMELYLVNGKDPLAEAINKGLILNVTLNEADAAIQAAAATPDPDDDTRASELAHRGSFRFFSKAQTAGSRGK